MSVSKIACEKTQLRQLVIAKRDALAQDRRAQDSEAICTKLFDLLVDSNSLTANAAVAVFCSFGSEVSLNPLIERLTGTRNAERPQLVAPISLGNRHMEFVMVEPHELLDRDSMPHFLAHPAQTVRKGIPTDRTVVTPACITFMVVPGVAFDRARGRLGYGAGYYDTYLTREGFHAKTCAVCFDNQLLPETQRVPHEATDHLVDMIVTPTRVI